MGDSRGTPFGETRNPKTRYDDPPPRYSEISAHGSMIKTVTRDNSRKSDAADGEHCSEIVTTVKHDGPPRRYPAMEEPRVVATASEKDTRLTNFAHSTDNGEYYAEKTVRQHDPPRRNSAVSESFSEAVYKDKHPKVRGIGGPKKEHYYENIAKTRLAEPCPRCGCTCGGNSGRGFYGNSSGYSSDASHGNTWEVAGGDSGWGGGWGNSGGWDMGSAGDSGGGCDSGGFDSGGGDSGGCGRGGGDSGY